MIRINRGPTTTRLLEHLVATYDEDQSWYGLEIIRDTGIGQGSVYRLLGLLVDQGWIGAEESHAPRRSRARWYRWAPGGRAAVVRLLDKPRRAA